ncbi:DUF1236 domain-containing protein [Pseudolabrys taiwanensis]|uniref:DUF1236 domain-containing protein n=1 Tax=Pseudolabrys taiwanensis TaxID=331696 RepID=A0A345ZZD4_9HYPH|nr:DUF1236 domain-containing protein [Pseudolabrys taiwanensis]AXK82281.1 DUF1236 domain-containing protein [Pseudolabrys taiwanensis]
MKDDLSREQEQRGTSQVLVWGMSVAVVLILLSFVWLVVPISERRTDQSAGGRSVQTQGTSTVARDTPPPPASSPNASSPATVGRNQDITASSSASVAFTSQQVDTIKKFAGSAPQVEPGTFTLSVGAAVPRNVEVHDMPGDLGQALPSYARDQYLVAGDRFVIVETSTQRIIAIVPIS